VCAQQRVHDTHRIRLLARQTVGHTRRFSALFLGCVKIIIDGKKHHEKQKQHGQSGV